MFDPAKKTLFRCLDLYLKFHKSFIKSSIKPIHHLLKSWSQIMNLVVVYMQCNAQSKQRIGYLLSRNAFMAKNLYRTILTGKINNMYMYEEFDLISIYDCQKIHDIVNWHIYSKSHVLIPFFISMNEDDFYLFFMLNTPCVRSDTCNIFYIIIFP